ncbi:hypothetical protein [Stenotrophomonas sp. NY11291]|uniref:hypothetical protein n=1 Tax=Stenotrophomonas sp. NY11291 TaxID=2939415 RepID=UPI00200D74E8|nr:hypothetical protein [Stenotrophomonas sp. NY11291]UQA20935.1 hypothetical protein M1L61_14220 [Stenotrophomonas sp. NY11291]
MTDIDSNDILQAGSAPVTLPPPKHGGLVQLEDGLLPCPFCGAAAERIDFGIGSGENEGGSCIACTVCQHSGPIEFGFKENFVSNWNRRALSAQPSPGGQGDGRIPFETWAKSQNYDMHRSAGGPTFVVGEYTSELTAGAWEAWQYLSARQPVGEPVAWLVHWSDMPMESPEVTRSASRIAEVSALTHPPRVVPLYAARPAQAVDLGRIRSTVQALLNWIDDWAETPEESGIDAIEIEAAAVLDLIDSQAVGK